MKQFKALRVVHCWDFQITYLLRMIRQHTVKRRQEYPI